MRIQDKFYKAIEENNIEIVKKLLNHPEVDPSFGNNYAIDASSEKGCFEIAKLLLNDSRVNPSDNHNHPIFIASLMGHYNIVKLLLNDKRVDPSDRSVIRACAENGYCDILKLLLNDDRTDPSGGSNWAIKLAKLNKHHKAVNLLWNDKRVKNSLKKDDELLYNELKALDIQKKAGNF